VMERMSVSDFCALNFVLIFEADDFKSISSEGISPVRPREDLPLKAW